MISIILNYKEEDCSKGRFGEPWHGLFFMRFHRFSHHFVHVNVQNTRAIDTLICYDTLCFTFPI